ncbi:MAG: fused MFS/spermidine synthase [Candidatus Thermoplasmatota archaeon]|jgi:spermidine synthase|nr:fused MFS/spermidine synthase [Candidatus Thermoplasmatota archaeon]MDP7265578.1 fused MFS/spermidine synthase [Candidatus Thermoplasmatota archaeon]
MSEAIKGISKRYRRVILLFMFFTGLCSFGYEVLLERAVGILIGSSSVAMGLIISTFIMGYLSSFYFGKLADRTKSKRKLVTMLAMLECLICVALVLVIPITRYSLFIADYLSYFIFFYYLDYYYVLLITIGLIALIVPLLMGAEIPIAMKLMAWVDKEEGHDTYGDVGKISGKIFTVDSLGAGLGGLLTALFFIPFLGRTYTSLLLALTTLCAGMILLFTHQWYVRQMGLDPLPGNGKDKKANYLRRKRATAPYKIAVVILFVILLIVANISEIENRSIDRFYGGNVRFHMDSKYQEIVITEHEPEGVTLYLNGQLQISELDDAMYHEFLIHPALVTHPAPRKVLVIGGGDGGAVEEILKHDTVVEITFVELDIEVINVCKKYLKSINNNCFDDPRVDVKITDGRIFVRDYKGEKFDVVVGDLPDPDTEAVAMLYTTEFFGDVKNVLKEDGIFVLQSCSWFEYPKITMSVVETLHSVFSEVDLYLYNVWTYGPWSSAVGSSKLVPRSMSPKDIDAILEERTVTTEYYNGDTHNASFFMSKNPFLESARKDARISTIDRPILQNPWE